MIEDLDQCDVDRVELEDLKLSYEKLNVSNSVKESSLKNLRNDLKESILLNDSLMTEITDLKLNTTKKNTSLRKQRNWWMISAIAGIASSFAVHYHWKYAKND
jgi:hypothetical protein